MDLTKIAEPEGVAVRHSDWKALAVWALIALLSIFTWYTNKQFDSIDSRLRVVEANLQQVLRDSDKRITELELANKYRSEIVLPCK